MIVRKPCARCHQTKPLDEFPPNRNTRDGRGSYCRRCQADVMRESRRRRGYDREYARSRAEAAAARWVRDRHPDIWAQLLADQEAAAGLPGDRRHRDNRTPERNLP